MEVLLDSDGLARVMNHDRLSVVTRLLFLHGVLSVEVWWSFNWVASAALGVMMTMLLVVFICCHTAAAGLPYHAALQITQM